MLNYQQIYTIGYAGRKPEDIERLLNLTGAVLFDVRYSPRSIRPEWSRKQLQERLGNRYVHAPELGNVNHKDPNCPIAIADFPVGLELIRATDTPIVLMCVCKNAKACHRTTIRRMLGRLGYINIVEVHDVRQAANPALFVTA